MKCILLFGAGKSATALIRYLSNEIQAEGWQLTVVDANLEMVRQKLNGASNARAVSFNINDNDQRNWHIKAADLVISLLPPALHILVANDCIAFQKNLLTASYIDEDLKKLRPQIEKAGLLFLCEMGLDPGIDHMSAKQMIDGIQESGGAITSFISHCGGLVAPESDDNPWHYKISWNPRNVVLAGKAGAVYKYEHSEKMLSYEDLFAEKRFTGILNNEPLCWYPNRDSLSYIDVYGLQSCATFIRTTLRHPDFMQGWKNIIALKLTDEILEYEAENKSLKTLFKEHLEKNNFSAWLEQRLNEPGENIDKSLLVHPEGGFQAIDIDDVKLNAAADPAISMHNPTLALKQLVYLGLDDDETKMQTNKCSAADLLQYALEKKLALQESDKDMVVMKHEIGFECEHKRYRHTSTLIVKGEDSRHTAMAKTVGLPLGIAAKLILKGVITCTGLRIPIAKEIYEPVLAELRQHDIQFQDEKEELL